MRKHLFLAGLCIMTSGLLFSQSEKLHLNSDRSELKAPLPAAYSNSTATVSSETNSGVRTKTHQINLTQSEVPITSSTAPFTNRPEGFEDNLIFINGTVEDKPELGLSILDIDTHGMGAYGFNAQADGQWSVADDFILHNSYDISSIDIYAYVTGETPPSITTAYIQIWEGDPSAGGSVVWGDQTTNRMDATVNSDIRRVPDYDLDATNRKIERVTINTDGLHLDPGVYWMEISLGGTGGTGPWIPPISLIDETVTGNALQKSSGSWQAIVDSGTGDPQGIPFEVYGTSTDDCQESNPPYDWIFELGYLTNNTSRTANDVTLDAGKNFTMDNLLVYIMSHEPIIEANITYYDNDNGFPGNEIGSQNNVTIVRSDAIGSATTSSHNIYLVELSVDPFEFEGQENSETTYWIEVEANNSSGSNTFWSGIFDHVEGYDLVNDISGQWEYPRSNFDGTYFFRGACSPVLGADKFEDKTFSVYPNPTSDILNVESEGQIESIVVYNLLGQKVMDKNINADKTELDMTSLQKGVYILKVQMDGKEQSIKVIKN